LAAGYRQDGGVAVDSKLAVPERWRAQSRHLPVIVALLTALYGVHSIVVAVRPDDDDRWNSLEDFIPLPASASAVAITAASGLLMVFLAHGLYRRKRRAWRMAVALSGFLIVAHVVKTFHLGAAIAALVLLIILIAARREFYAQGDPTTRLLAIRAFLVITGAGFGAGLLMLELYHHRVQGSPSFTERATTVLLGMIGMGGPVRYVNERTDWLVSSVLAGFGILAAVVTLYLALRPQEPRPRLTSDDEKQLRTLLERQGHRDSLGYFALRADKSVVWSPTGKAGVSYRVLFGVGLASGDPIGDPEAWPGAIAPFLELCRQHAWVPAVVGCSAQAGTVYRRHGLHVLEIGDEAIVDAENFRLDGRSMRNVRQAVKRVARAGYVAEVRRQRDVPPAELVEMARVADAWREGNTERGFSMALGRFADPADADCVVVTARHDGILRALLNFAPWGPDGLSLDLMRRDRSADNGLNEFLITELLAACPDLGVRRVSLNFAMFRAALERGEQLGAGPVSKLWSRTLLFASRWWQIESLYRFNAKFGPQWLPRYICFPDTVSLARIAVATLEAEAFWRRPRPFRSLGGREHLGRG
jgi:lysyl-tRNA synthetase class 2